MGAVRLDLFLAVRSAFDRIGADEFWDVWSAGAEAGLLSVHQRDEFPVASGSQAFVGEGVLCIRGVDCVAGLLVAVVLVSSKGSEMWRRLSISSIMSLLLSFSFVGASNRLLMSSKAFASKVGRMPCIGVGVLSVVWATARLEAFGALDSS